MSDDAARTELIEILEAARALVSRPGNDYSWSSWRDGEHALSEVDGHLDRLRTGGELHAASVAILFAPTGPMQELAIESGWGGVFGGLADRFNAL